MDEFPLGEDMHHLPGDKLFDFMAEKLVKFAERIGKKWVVSVCTHLFLLKGMSTWGAAVPFSHPDKPCC